MYSGSSFDGSRLQDVLVDLKPEASIACRNHPHNFLTVAGKYRMTTQASGQITYNHNGKQRQPKESKWAKLNFVCCGVHKSDKIVVYHCDARNIFTGEFCCNIAVHESCIASRMVEIRKEEELARQAAIERETQAEVAAQLALEAEAREAEAREAEALAAQAAEHRNEH